MEHLETILEREASNITKEIYEGLKKLIKKYKTLKEVSVNDFIYSKTKVQKKLGLSTPKPNLANPNPYDPHIVLYNAIVEGMKKLAMHPVKSRWHKLNFELNTKIKDVFTAYQNYLIVYTDYDVNKL